MLSLRFAYRAMILPHTCMAARARTDVMRLGVVVVMAATRAGLIGNGRDDDIDESICIEMRASAAQVACMRLVARVDHSSNPAPNAVRALCVVFFNHTERIPARHGNQ